MAFRSTRWIALGLYGSLSLACQSSEQETASGGASPSPEHAEHAAQPSQPTQVTAPAGAKVFFVEPKDGAEVSGPLTDGKVNVHVKMGAEGITVQAAGQQVEGTGHHHIIIDGEPLAAGGVVPKDDAHLHFGKGQTEAELSLAPGEHALTLQFADGAHLSYGPQLASAIKIKVAEGAPAPVPPPSGTAPKP
jgi:hypothetical protein